MSRASIIRVAIILAGYFAIVAIARAQTIYVSNTATNVTDASLADALPAFQAAIDQDFAPAWNQSATLVQLAPDAVAPAGSATIALSDVSDVYGAAGYHSITPGDTPYAKVFTSAGINWQLVFSHELFELLADPHVDRATFVWPADPWARPSRFVLLEVGDPVERQRYAYTRPSATGQPVVISDFVTERWYDCQGGQALDYGRHVKHCLHVLAGGYMTGFGDLQRVHGRMAAIFRVRG